MNTYNMPFAGPLKRFVIESVQSHPQLHTMLTEKFGKNPTQQDTLDFFNDLKDNRSSNTSSNLNLLTHNDKGLNVRMILQLLGSEILRSVDANIHVKFIASEALAVLKTDSKSVIFIPDVRFKNEAMFVVNFNSKKTINEKILFCEEIISSELTLGENCVFNEDFSVNPAALKKAFTTHFGAPESNPFIKKVFENTLLAVTTLSKSIKKVDNNNVNPLATPDTLKTISFAESIESGILKIFRPAFSRTGNLDNVKSLDEAILQYSKISQVSLDLTKQLYEEAGIEFNEGNVAIYGARRAPMLHISETDLNGYFPESFLNFPAGTAEAKKSISNLSKTFTNILNKKTSSGTIIIGGVGSAGHGKDYIISILTEIANNKEHAVSNNISTQKKK